MTKTTSVKGGIISAKAQEQTTPARAAVSPLQNLLSRDDVKERFNSMLGKKSAGFISSILTVYNSNNKLKTANPASVLSAASIAASIDLPIVPSLGRAYIVPYKGSAQFQLGYLGLVELAQRSGMYKFINVVTVYEGEIESFNKFTEEIKLGGEATSTNVVGYCAAFELLNGFRKTVFWTIEKVREHAKRFSQSYGSASSPWSTDFDRMAEKTVLAYTLKHWGPLSIEMQTAMDADREISPDYNNLPKASNTETEIVEENIDIVDADFNDPLDSFEQEGLESLAQE